MRRKLAFATPQSWRASVPPAFASEGQVRRLPAAEEWLRCNVRSTATAFGAVAQAADADAAACWERRRRVPDPPTHTHPQHPHPPTHPQLQR